MPASAETHVSDAPLPLFGHTDILDRMHVGLQQNRLHHGWILGGDEGIGKFRLAQQIAAWILSVADDNSAGLFEGEAPASLHPSAVPVDGEEARLVFGNAHPDLLVIQPEEDEKNKSGLIKTEQIRKLSAFFAHHSARSKWRVAIVDNLDVVNRAGMNAMLKTLEEPPSNCLLLLISSQIGGILPTIRSRCITANLAPLSATETSAVLHRLWPDADPDQLEILAALSKGSPGRALQLAEAAILDLFQASCTMLLDVKTKPADLIHLAEKWAGGGARNRPVRRAASYLFPELLLLASLYRVGGASADQNPLAPIDFIDQTARALASRLSAEQLACQYQDFIRAYQMNERLYLDFAPVMTKFFFDLHSQSGNR